jgi:mono/diheme cytochrome c family protein
MDTRRTVFFLLGGLAALGVACSDEVKIPPPDDLDADSETAEKDASTPGPDGGGDQAPCLPVQALPGPARVKITGGNAAGGGGSGRTVTVADLYEAFKGQCSACHATTALSPFAIVSEGDFAERVTELSLERMNSEDPTKVMPMGKTLLKDRLPTDPVVQFEARLEAWLMQGKPASFPDPLAAPGDAPSGDSPYALSRELGESLTNMGSCIPAARILRTETDPMAQMDAMFAALPDLKSLPSKLSQTDLFTLDNEALAKRGVISFAPAYTLWADDAKKMRYVRVPQGESIKFVESTQSFDIPDNTRFYKTFLKEVKDVDGKLGYRKIETRLIVVRPAVDSGSGIPDIKALFGTYRWNEDETEAELVTEPLNNGQPFADVVMGYVEDEKLNEDVRKEDYFQNVSEIERESYLYAKGAMRHYAIPGSKRCVDCHMGGKDGDFILGFTPLQIRRRMLGEGGVIEEAGPDELNQLERFIDYGLITGISKGEIAKKILPLEKSQGSRLPRNDYELIAQGYMLGNCAHCHNPNGFPSRTAPVLRDVLNFMPGPDVGGVFQFPLDKVSPRIRRGPNILTPYITPSLEEQPSFSLQGVVELPGDLAFLTDEVPPPAPWRSLIYRNVDTTFTYSDGKTIFPHMPMDTAGFDCRAPRIMAEWMISIPSELNACQTDIGGPTSATSCSSDLSFASKDGNAFQPYREILPGQPGYEQAKITAIVRLLTYRAGERYKSCERCPDTFDPNAASDQPASWEMSVLANANYSPVQVPTNECHWVKTDLTVRQGTWEPRNGLWQKVIVEGDTSSFTDPVQQVVQESLVGVLQGMQLDDELKEFALKEVPFGWWKDNPGCSFPGVPSAETFSPDPRYDWLDNGGPGDRNNNPNGHVYMQSAGAAVFNAVCVNCHGEALDASGRQADTVAQLSGGRTTVANWRDGMFGPAGATDQSRQSVFSHAPMNAGSVDDWAARYMAWMALGGTAKAIPPPVLGVIGSEPVLGRAVARNIGEVDANMLAVVKNICRTLLPASEAAAALFSSQNSAPAQMVSSNGDSDLWESVCYYKNPSLVLGATVELKPRDTSAEEDGIVYPDNYVGIARKFLREDPATHQPTYPTTALVLRGETERRADPTQKIRLGLEPDVDTQTGMIKARTGEGRSAERRVELGLSEDNLRPVCFLPDYSAGAAFFEDASPEYRELAAYWTERGELPKNFPWCPKSLMNAQATPEDEMAWTLRGAANAGFMVYAYADALSRGSVKVQPPYDQCELLEPKAP